MAVVRFDGVSKRYRLGLTRRSLPTAVSDWVGERLGAGAGPKSRDDLWALDDVSFQLDPGDSLALIGPNGAGKTTVLKLAANIAKPTRGSVAVNGRLSALIELGAGFHPDLTGRDNAFLNGAILGIGRRELQKRFDEIVEFSGLERFIDTPVKRYSSGMTVRLGFAVAACIDPDVLLVDEVLAVGDAAFSQKCLARIAELLRKGTAVVFVSHNLYLVKAVCTRSVYLRNGRVQMAGDTMPVIQAYERDLGQDRAVRRTRPEARQESAPGTVEITGVDIVASDGTVNPERLLTADPADIRIGYIAYEDVGRVHVSVFIRRLDGLLCCMLRSSLDGWDLRVRAGAGTVRLQFERLQLASGTYYADAYFLNDNDSLVITPAVGSPTGSRWPVRPTSRTPWSSSPS